MKPAVHTGQTEYDLYGFELANQQKLAVAP